MIMYRNKILLLIWNISHVMIMRLLEEGLTDWDGKAFRLNEANT
jgi:hypothetical protein